MAFYQPKHKQRKHSDCQRWTLAEVDMSLTVPRLKQSCPGLLSKWEGPAWAAPTQPRLPAPPLPATAQGTVDAESKEMVPWTLPPRAELGPHSPSGFLLFTPNHPDQPLFVLRRGEGNLTGRQGSDRFDDLLLSPSLLYHDNPPTCELLFLSLTIIIGKTEKSQAGVQLTFGRGDGNPKIHV